jgi:hypothetical protein
VSSITRDRLFVVLTSILRWIGLFEISRLINHSVCEVMQGPSYKQFFIFIEKSKVGGSSPGPVNINFCMGNL